MKSIKEVESISKQSAKPMNLRMLSLAEESGEVIKAFNKDRPKEEMAEELADTLQVCLDILFALGLTIEEIDKILSAKNKKWRDKYILPK